jgi:Putative small multi-drug export protein
MVFCTLAMMYTPAAMAAKKVAVAAAATPAVHLHTGQKIANYFRSFGIPDVVVLAMIAAMPVVELRGAIPVGVWMNLPITTVLLASVIGNMVPIVPLLFLLKNERLK